MFFCGSLNRKFGYEACLAVVYFAYLIRYAGFYFLENPWLALPLEAFHSICIGLMYLTAMSFANSIAPSGAPATLQVSKISSLVIYSHYYCCC